MMLMQVAMSAKAQYDAAFSHYFDMETSFNPAAAGKENKLNVNLAYALNFTGFENHPRTMYASADLPFYARLYNANPYILLHEIYCIKTYSLTYYYLICGKSSRKQHHFTLSFHSFYSVKS